MHTTNLGPHSALNSKNASQRFVLNLFDRLWEKYRSRVSYVNNYETLIHEASATKTL